MKSLPQLFSGFGDSVTQAIEQALQLGVSLGQSVADIAQSVEQALMQPLYRALTIAGDWLTSGFRDAQSSVMAGAEGVSGWVWIGGTCAMCVAMSGSVHAMSEDMETHIGCGCEQQFFSGEPPDDIVDGADWFDEQDDETQQDIIGSQAGWRAYKDGAVTLQDFVGIEHSEEWGTSRYQKSLKEILGAKGAAQYYG